MMSRPTRPEPPEGLRDFQASYLAYGQYVTELNDHITALEAENAVLRAEVLRVSENGFVLLREKLGRAVELLRRWRVAGIDHDLHDDTDAFLKENP